MGDYFAAQAIAIAAGRKYAQSEASEKIRPKGVVKKEEGASAQPNGTDDGARRRRWG
jgi:hypothetical protein